MNVIDTAAFEILILPLLKLLPPTLEPASTPLNKHRYKNLFRTVLGAYIDQYVQKEPPALGSWKRQRKGCGCNDSSKLDKFLTNSRQSVGRFPSVIKIRQHLEQQLAGSHCNLSTEKTASPHTLVVSKTSIELEHDLVAWKQRCGIAVKSLEEIGIDKLRELLQDQFEPIMEMRAVRLPGPFAFQDSPVADLLANVLQPKPRREHQRQPLSDATQAQNAGSIAERLFEKTSVGI